MKIDPREFGLSRQTVLEEIEPDHFALVMARKSRIIMADGKKIAEKAEKIKKLRPGSRISLKTAAPLCGKTRAFLDAMKIEIME